MSYRNDVDALEARYSALTAEVHTKTRELDDARKILEDAQARAKLPVLPNIRVASPCTADWQAMTGDERVRMCGSCNKNVYNLSSMTRDEAEALIREKEGKLCVRYFQRTDGTILLKDCTVGVTQRRKRRIIAAGAAAFLASGGGVFLALRGGKAAPAPKIVHEDIQDHAMMGEMEVSHEPPAPVSEPEHWQEVKGGMEMPQPHVVKMGKVAIHPDALKK